MRHNKRPTISYLQCKTPAIYVNTHSEEICVLYATMPFITADKIVKHDLFIFSNYNVYFGFARIPRVIAVI